MLETLASKTGGRHKLSACTGHGDILPRLLLQTLHKVQSKHHHSTWSEQCLQVIWQFWSPSVTWIHGDVHSAGRHLIPQCDCSPLLPDSPFSPVSFLVYSPSKICPETLKGLSPRQAWSLSPQRRTCPHVAWWRGRSAESAVPPRTTPPRRFDWTHRSNTRIHSRRVLHSGWTQRPSMFDKERFWHQKIKKYIIDIIIIVCMYMYVYVVFFWSTTLRFILPSAFSLKCISVSYSILLSVKGPPLKNLASCK